MQKSSTLLLFLFLCPFCRIHSTTKNVPIAADIQTYPYIVTYEEIDSEESNYTLHGVLIHPSWVLTTRSVIELLSEFENGSSKYQVVSEAFNATCNTTISVQTTTMVPDNITNAGNNTLNVTIEAKNATELTNTTSDINMTVSTSTPEIKCDATKREIKKSFVFKDTWWKADLGMTRLDKPFNISDGGANFKPISLPKHPFSPGDCKKPMVVGYGVSQSGDNNSRPLQTLQVELLNFSDCGHQSPVLPDITTICMDSKFCPTNKAQLLICADEDEHYLIGLLSNLDRCRKPYTVTDVSSVMTWIHGISKVEVAFKSRPQSKDPSTVERNLKLYAKAPGLGRNFKLVLAMVVIIYVWQ